MAPNHFRMEVIIIRDPADIQTIVDKYSITNKNYIDEIKSRFITEKKYYPVQPPDIRIGRLGSFGSMKLVLVFK